MTCQEGIEVPERGQVGRLPVENSREGHQPREGQPRVLRSAASGCGSFGLNLKRLCPLHLFEIEEKTEIGHIDSSAVTRFKMLQRSQVAGTVSGEMSCGVSGAPTVVADGVGAAVDLALAKFSL